MPSKYQKFIDSHFKKLIFITYIENIIIFIFALFLIIFSIIFVSANIITEMLEKSISGLLDLSSVNVVAYILLVASVLLIAVLFLGSYGLIKMNRQILLLFELSLLMLFVLKGTSIIILGFSTFESSFRENVNDIFDMINSDNNPGLNCRYSYNISSTFKCCGSNGPQDFINQSLVGICCFSSNRTNTMTGCSDKIMNQIRGMIFRSLEIPTFFTMMLEFTAIISVSFLVGDAIQRPSESDLRNRRYE